MKRILPVAFVVLVACNRARTEPAPAPSGSASSAIPTVDVVPVVEKPLDTTIALEGELAPYERVAIFARASGFVSQVLVDRGSRVKRGQLLIALVAPELGAQRAEADAKLKSDRSTLERLKAAAETPGAVARQEVEVAEAAVQAGQARLDALRTTEQYLALSAPFDGIVTERNVHPGALVGPQAGITAVPLLRIEQVHKLRLTVAVPETLVGGIADGVMASFSVRAFPGVVFTAVTRRIAQSIDTKTRSMPVELDVDNGDGRLAPGMFANVVWPVKRTAASIFVPSSAIVQSTERTFVARVKEGVVEQVPVQRGIVQGDLVEIFGAVHAGDVVAKRAADDMRSGTRVQIRSPAAARSN